MFDLVKRSLEILKDTAKESGKDYTENVQSLITEAKAIRSEVSQTAQTSVETFSQMRSGGVIKKLSDWFFNNGENYESNALDGEGDNDFDAGFDTDTDDEGNDVPKVLDAESMKDITRGQLKAMYNIGGKQAEVNTANTAEIVSSINNRSSEMTASINNMNKTLLSISNKLDKYIEFQTELYRSTEKANKQRYDDKNPLMDYNGNLTLSGLFNAAQKSTSDNIVVSLLSSLKSMASGGMMEGLDPATLLSLAIDFTNVKGKKIKALGNRSIDDIGNFFNEAVGAATQTALSELMDSKLFKKFFPGVGDTTGDRNYGDLRPNQYSTKPAVFDGVTRQSIVHIIPEYLKKINESLSGKRFDIDKHGHLSETVDNKTDFAKITSNAFNNDGLTNRASAAITESARALDVNISSSDISMASSALMMVCVMHMHQVGKSAISMSYILANEATFIEKASKTLAFATGKSQSYWSDICLSITQRLSTNMMDSTNFITTANKQLRTMIKEATEFAMGVQGDSAGRLTFDMAEEQFRQAYGNKSSSDNSDKQTDGKNTYNVQPTRSSNSQRLTQLDYTRGIFNLLNRGINVRVTNWDMDDTPYPKIKLTHDGGDSNDITKVVMKQIRPAGGNPLRIGMQFFAQDLNHQKSSDDDKKENNADGNTSSSNNSNDNKNNKSGDKDKEGSENSDDPDGKNKRKIDFIPDSIKNLIPSTIKDNAKKLGTIITGDKVEDENGNVTYKGGIISGIHNKINGVKNKITSGISNKVDDFVEEQKEKIEYRALQKDVSNMKTDTPEAEQDKIQAQHVFALMQTSTADGETSGDISQITKEINQIKDPKLKARLQESVTQMLKRSEKKAGEGSGKKGIFGFLLSGVKKLFSPVLKVLKGIGTAIRTVGQKILDLMKKGLKSGWEDIRSGAVGIKQGLFGNKQKLDGDGNVVQEESKGLVGSLVETIKSGMNTLKESIGSYIEKKSESKGNNEDEGNNEDAIQSLKDAKSEYDENKEDENESDGNTDKQSLLDKFRNTEFGAGFMSVFDATKARKEAKKPETYSDEKADEMSQMISGTKESIFSKIVDLASSIRDKLYEEENTESPELNTNNESGPDITTNTNTPDSGTVTNTNSDTSNGIGTSTISRFNTTRMNTDVGNSTSTESSGTGSSSTDNGTSPNITTTGDSGSNTSGGKSGGALGSLGKLLGGALSSLLGVGKIILTLLAPLKGFDMLKQVVESIWTNGIQPLNKIFKQIINIIKPIVKTLTEIISTIADSIATIVGIALDVVQPILEAISPILTSLLDTLKPILDIVGVLVKVLLTPLMSVVKFVITPILRNIGNNIQIQLGVLQVGFGIIMTALGGILMGIGSIVKFLTMNSSILDSGKSMASMGKDMITGGINSVKQGIQGTIELIKDTVGQFTGQTDEKKETEEKKENKTQETVESSGSIMDGVVGSGDPSIPDMYGSGNKMDQHSYGNYMNMSERGCGPIAIADAYKRRTGTKIDPSKLAAQMSSSGTYDIKRGTPLSGFVNTSRGLGVNVKVGGVTASSLKQATPNNPITVLGSGTGYGTRKGNNHYMNVIASDKYGGVYVSNPMTGKVQRQSMSDVVGGAQVGLYGSGDSDDLGFTLDDSIKEAFAELAETAGSLLSIFNFEKSTEDEVNEQLQAEQEAEAARQAKYTLDSKTYGGVLIEATKLFQKENPKRDGESDEEYNKRFEESKDKYIARVSGNAMINSTKSLTDSMMTGINNTKKNAESVTDEVYNAGSSIQGQNEQSSSTSGGNSNISTNGGFISNDGKSVLKFPDGQTPQYTDVDALDTDANGFSSHSPLHEFFRITTGQKAWTEYDGWFNRRQDPDKTGMGHSGEYHNGVDIHTENDDNGVTPLYATTDGTVTIVDPRDSTGNVVSWTDNSGYYHTYMHMSQPTKLSVGDKVEGGKTLMGYIGKTGTGVTGYHLHYQISENQWVKDQGGQLPNPLEYFKYQAPKTNFNSSNAQGRIQMTDMMSENSAWYAYDDKQGVPGFIKAGQDAGMTPAQIATILSTVIWEDSGEKVFGDKSLTDVTYDYNGQQAVGLMNWVDTDGDYGNTVEDQMKYIYNAYFSDDAWHSRAKVVNDGYNNPNYNWGSAFETVTGRKPQLSVGDRYGAYMNKDLAEGAAQFFGNALVPMKLTTAKGLAENVGTAVDAYNWMIDNGYIKSNDTSKTNTSKSKDSLTKQLDKALEFENSYYDKPNKSYQENESGLNDQYNKSLDFATTYKPGSGDIPPVDNDVIRNIFGNGDSGFDISTVDDISSLDSSSITKKLYNLSSEGNTSTVVNTYKIQPNDDYQREQLKAILTNTYNVRAERIEELLEKILETISKDKNSNGKGKTTSGGESVSPELFTNNEIPSQVMRLFS